MDLGGWPQAVFSHNLANMQFIEAEVKYSEHSFWLKERIIPVYVAAASILVLALHGINASKAARNLRAKWFPGYDETVDEPNLASVEVGTTWDQAKRRVKAIGGPTIVVFKLVRLGLVLALFSLVTLSALRTSWTRENIAFVAVLTYSVLLAVLNAITSVAENRHFSTHLTVLTLSIFALYAYRDVWPLMTLELHPKDGGEGRILWAKVALSGLIGVVAPVLEPYPYVPVNPKRPSLVPNPEQTASIFSLLTFTFMDSTIYKGSRQEHLAFHDLPLICDYDESKHLIKQNYPFVDPFSGAKKGHLFFALLKIHKRSFLYQGVILVLMAMFNMASPIGTNRLLNYLEQRGEDAFVKPWVWILCIASGPLFLTVLYQLYIFLSVRSFVRTEALVSSLLFDHALRIRVKAELAKREETIVHATGTSSSSTQADTKGTGSPQSESGDEDDADAHSRTATTVSTATAATSSTVTVVAPVTPQATTSDAKKSERKGKDKPKLEENRKNLLGKINNLITSDLNNITNGRDFLFVFLSAPLQVTFGMIFLYVVLGWSSFVGLAVMLALMPLPAKVASLMSGVQQEKMKATDARVQTVTETMNVLRMIKLFGWEARVKESVAEKRNVELKMVWTKKLLETLNGIINHTVPLIHMVVTFGVFTLVQRKALNASIVFSSLTAFGTIRHQLFRIFYEVPAMIQANVSLGRVADFLRNTELLDEFTEKPMTEIVVDSSADHRNEIGFGKATFSWSSDASDGTLTPSSQAFRLHVDNEVIFKKGGFNLITGPTGSGKTSMLMALLGEMHYVPSGPESWRNLPRESGVAYAAQESWVLSETIKDNILFGSPFDEERYKKVLYQCALAPDLKLFEAGDATEVGEKGLTLSGGQKARVTLARAVYSPANVILLDDVLAALDVHTSRWIVEKCFKGDLLRDRTVLLVTHNVAMAAPLADFVVSLNTDGYVVSQGSVTDAVAKDSRLAAEMKHEEQAIELDAIEETITEPTSDQKGKLVVAEEIAIGRVSWNAYKLFLGSVGDRWPALFWVQYMTVNMMVDLLDVLETWWLGWWARQYTLTDPWSVSVRYYLGIYALIALADAACRAGFSLIWAYGSLKASRSIHARLTSALLGSTFRWLDITPTSRVISRCTQDIQAVDGQFPAMLDMLVGLTISVTAKLCVIVFFTPVFLLPAVVVAGLGLWLGKIYMKAQLPVKREMSNAKSPVIETLGSAIAGLTSIRAYSAQTSFKERMLQRVDRYTSVARTLYSLNRWISIRIDGLSAVFAASLVSFLIYGPVKYDPSSIGLILTVSASFNELILWCVRIYNEVEISANSLERILQYVTIEQESEPKDGGIPPAYWPASGSLVVENLTARYSIDGPKVLQDVSFRVEAGERVGVVGRTGSGKSTLTLSLLRCIPTEGTVTYDGIPTHTLNLDALRSNITIIPQVPDLLSGSLRHNLDFFGQYDDAMLNDALRAAGLTSLQRLSEENRMTLDTEIAAGGGNLSVGQRQIIALARAIVRQSKLLILDEATSAIDYETDAVIQESLRTELKKDVTVITVAHRLQTIMDSDKIMVLDAGRLTEFDSPNALLHKEGSLFRALVNESADKETLIAMAEGKIPVVALPTSS